MIFRIKFMIQAEMKDCIDAVSVLSYLLPIRLIRLI